jgi:hypothetical protein
MKDALPFAADAFAAVWLATICSLALSGPAVAAVVVERWASSLAVLVVAAGSAGCLLSRAYLAATSDKPKFLVI